MFVRLSRIKFDHAITVTKCNAKRDLDGTMRWRHEERL